MGLFNNKNPNESSYIGGQKHFREVIKNEAPGQLLIWQHPDEDFNTKSTLIVQPGEQAIFINNGQIAQIVDNGRTVLSTENYPFISRLRNAVSGGISSFSCKVYFVRKADSEELKWGTTEPLTVTDKVNGLMVKVKSRAVYKVRIEDPGVFLTKCIGNNIPFQTQQDLYKFFDGEFQGKIKSIVSRYLNSLNQQMIGLEAYIDEISEQIRPQLDEIVSEYGLRCPKFSLVSLEVDTGNYEKINDFQLDAIKKQREGMGQKAAMDALGMPNWEKQQAVNIMGSMAQNPGSGGLANVGAGLGMGLAAGSAFGTLAGQVFSNSPQDGNQNSAQEDPMQTLTKLKNMLDAGLISQDEYDSKKTEILGRM